MMATKRRACPKNWLDARKTSVLVARAADAERKGVNMKQRLLSREAEDSVGKTTFDGAELDKTHSSTTYVAIRIA